MRAGTSRPSASKSAPPASLTEDAAWCTTQGAGASDYACQYNPLMESSPLVPTRFSWQEDDDGDDGGTELPALKLKRVFVGQLR